MEDSSRKLSWWNTFCVFAIVLAALGGCVMLLSWTELNIGSGVTPSLRSGVKAISMLRHSIGLRSSSSSSSSSQDGDQTMQNPLVLEVPLSNSTGWEHFESSMEGFSGLFEMDSLAEAVQEANAFGLQAGNNSSSSSSSSSTDSTCTCMRADPKALRQHCSVVNSGWPGKNEQLVTQCFDFLVNNASQYLQKVQHNPANNISCTRQLLHHTFWAGPMTWKLKAVIQSFLFTHYSNDTSCRPKPVLNVWLQTVEPTRDQLEQWAKEWDAPYFLCSDQLQFRRWQDDAWLDWLPPTLLAKAIGNATDTSALHAAVRASAASGSRVSYSDAVRFLVLYKYGGIYTDGDVLLLRKLEAFTHYDFLYEWSFVKQGMNTAVFGAAQKSPFTAAVIQVALKTAVTVNATTGNVTFDVVKFNSVFHPMAVLRRVPPKIAARVEALPSIPFDPVWLTLDTPAGKTHNLTQIHVLRAWKDFFVKPASYMTTPAVATDVFKGAFTHHWHNTWSAPFVESSLIGQLVSIYDRFLEGKQPNSYGLKATLCAPIGEVASVQTRRQV